MQRYNILLLFLILISTNSFALSYQYVNPTGNGLWGEYFNGNNFEEKIYARTDRNINFNYLGLEPAPGVNTENFSIRWTGQLLAPQTGSYKIRFIADDGIRFWLNGKLLLNEWNLHEAQTFTREVDLKAGQLYDIKIEYYNDPLHAVLRFSWETPDSGFNLWGFQLFGEDAIIPKKYLFSKPRQPVSYVKEVPPVQEIKLASNKKTSKPADKVSSNAFVSRKEIIPPVPEPAIYFSKPNLKKKVVATEVKAQTDTLQIKPANIKPTEEVDKSNDIFTNLEAGHIITLNQVFFEQSKSNLLPESFPELQKLVNTLHKYPDFKIEIAGHTDNIGDVTLNKALSLERAKVVAGYLIQNGISEIRITTKGFGGLHPIADNANPAERAKNRRVTFKVQ